MSVLCTIGKGRISIVPIFPNKKKRPKQALYANPSMDDFTVNEGMDEIGSLDHSLYPEESGYFETESFGKDGFGYPSYGDPGTNKIQDKNPGRQNPSTSTPSYPCHSYGKSMVTTRIANGNNRGGKENSFKVRDNSNSISSSIETSKGISTPRQNFNANSRSR